MRPPKYIDNLPIYDGTGDTIGIYLGTIGNIHYPVYYIHDDVVHIKLVNDGGTNKVVCYDRGDDALSTADFTYGSIALADALIRECALENVTAGTGNDTPIVLTDVVSKFVKA